MTNYILAVLILSSVSCDSLDKNYRSNIKGTSFASDVAEGEIESSEDNLTDIEQGAGPDYSEPENESTDKSDLPSVAEAVNTMLTAELNNAFNEFKKNPFLILFNPNMNLDVTKITDKVDQMILDQTTMEQLRSNQEQIISDIQELTRSEMIASTNIMPDSFDEHFAEPAAQMDSKLRELFE